MDRGDWYFIAGFAMDALAFFGIEWKHLRAVVYGKKPVSSAKRQIFLVFLILFGIGLSSLGWYKLQYQRPSSLNLNISVYDPPYPAPLRVITGQTFEDQDVPLDGYIYENTTFKHVCFLYDGGAFGIHNSTVSDGWKVCVKDQRLQNHSALLEQLRITNKPRTTRPFVSPR